MTKIKRERVIKAGIFFLILGFLFLIPNHNLSRFVGAVEVFIGCLSCMIYNIEKFKFIRLLDKSLRDMGYAINFKSTRTWCVIICIVLFILNSIVWGWLVRLGIITSLVFQIVGCVFTILLLPAFSRPDAIEEELAKDSAKTLIDQLNNKLP